MSDNVVPRGAFIKASRTASLDGFEGRGLNMDSVEWLELAQNAILHKFPEGQALLTEGEKIDHLVIVMEGTVRVERKNGETMMRTVTRPELYGESWFLNQPACVSVRVVSASAEVIFIYLESEMGSLFINDPDLRCDASPQSKRRSSGLPMSPSRNRSISIKAMVSRSPTDRLSVTPPPPSELPPLPTHAQTHVKVERVASDPSSASFQDALRRQKLFFHIAAALLFRLQESIHSYEPARAPGTNQTTAPSKSAGSELKVPRPTHRRTPSKTFVGKMLQRAAAKTRLEETVTPAPISRGNKGDKQSEKYVKKFRLPKTEKLLKECEATWLAPEDSSPMEGRLYIGESFVCFLGNGFAFHTKLVTPLAQVASWTVAHRRLVLKLHPPGPDAPHHHAHGAEKYIYMVKDEQLEGQVREIFSNRKTNEDLLANRPASLQRKESWVLKHHIDPVASESFNLQDCILLLDCSQRRVYKAGETIIQPGERQATKGMWKIASGRVKIEGRDGQVIAVLGKNAFFGEISFFFPRVAATASIVALDEVVEVFFLQGSKLDSYFRTYPNFGARFFKYISTIAAHRFERFNRLFLSEYSAYIYQQAVGRVIFEGPDQPPSTPEEVMIQLNNQQIKFSTAQGLAGKIALVEVLKLELGDTTVTIKTRSGFRIVLTFEDDKAARHWYVAIDSACFSSYELKVVSADDKYNLLSQLFRGTEDVEIRHCTFAGEAIEQWLYNPVRGSVISLAIDRHVQYTWDGVLYVPLPLIPP